MAGIEAINTQHASSPNASELRQRVGEFVGVAFFGPLFAQARRSIFREDSYFSGGPGQEAFEARLHEEFARQIGQATSFQLNEAIISRLQQRNGGQTHGT